MGTPPPKGANEVAGKTQYKNTWQKENVDRVNLTMPKGRKDIIKAHAEAQRESVNGFINRAIDHQISQDRRKGPSETLQGTSESGSISFQEAIQTAQNAAQMAGETVSQFVERAVETQAQRDEASLKLGINPSTGGKLKNEEA